MFDTPYTRNPQKAYIGPFRCLLGLLRASLGSCGQRFGLLSVGGASALRCRVSVSGSRVQGFGLHSGSRTWVAFC